MTIGSSTLLAIAAAALATLVWWAAVHFALPQWLCMFLFGVGLAVVIIAGPLLNLP